MAKNKAPRAKFNKTKTNFINNSTKNTPANRKNASEFFVCPSSPSRETNTKKKPFDKNKWRLQKYSMKHKVDSWEDRRKKAIVHGYKKERKQDKCVKFDVSKIYDEEEKRAQEESVDKIISDDKPHKDKAFKKPHQQFLDKKEQKERQREEFLRKKAEKEDALKEYKRKKIERYKKLNKKTRKGQPIMKERMEYLLEKIQKSIDM